MQAHQTKQDTMGTLFVLFDCIESNVIIARVTPKISIDQANVVALNS